eukprot:4084705-Amphidinium_carterae.1
MRKSFMQGISFQVGYVRAMLLQVWAAQEFREGPVLFLGVNAHTRAWHMLLSCRSLAPIPRTQGWQRGPYDTHGKAAQR